MSAHSQGKKHKKKRNAGLMYEFLIRYIVERCFYNDTSSSDLAVSIIKRHYRKNTELFKEWRLASSIISTVGVSESVANTIIRETRDAVRKMDRKKLDYEKSMLIREINHSIGQSLYGHEIDGYTLYATIQTLFDDWRNNNVSNIGRIAEYERKVHEHICTQGQKNIVEAPDPVADALVIKLMIEKLNKKYASFSDVQRSILGRWSLEGTSPALIAELKSIKETTLNMLNEYIQVVSCDNSTLKKLTNAYDNISAIDTSTLSDGVVARCMKLCDLHVELTNKKET